MSRELFIQKLNKQPEFNRGIQHTKLNIHFSVRGEIVDYCLDLNSEIQKITDSEIDFSAKSFQVPHLTIEMGYVKNSNDYFNLMESIEKFTTGLEKFSVNLLPPYLSHPKPNYVFIDTDKDDFIFKIKKEAKEAFRKWLIPLKWDVSKSEPHITVGYITKDFDIVNRLLSKYNKKLQWNIESVEVSFVGARGSCLGTIREFEIGKNYTQQWL